MKEEIRDVLDFKVPMKLYETVDEADKAAGKVGAALAECNNNLAYRGTYADARDLIVIVTEELSGLLVRTKKVKKGEKEVDVPDESEKEFVARALASNGTTKEEIQEEVTSRARNGWSYKDDEGKDVSVDALAVDIRARVRQAPKPPKLSAEVLESAKNNLAKLDDEKITKALHKFLPKETVFKRTGDTEKDAQTLGKLLRDWIKAQQAQALGGFGGGK